MLGYKKGVRIGERGKHTIEELDVAKDDR